MKIRAWSRGGVAAALAAMSFAVFSLQKEVAAVLKNPELAKRLADIGAEPVGSPPAEQEAILKKQIVQFRPIIQTLKLD